MRQIIKTGYVWYQGQKVLVMSQGKGWITVKYGREVKTVSPSVVKPVYRMVNV
ncbi:hypothetical protein [Acinetobacter thermotolerans]|uniref:hypothetical protein n=1 Tax=Acinetobacter thermotolerans TaxID=3151487 RepID=UPI00325BAC56